MKRLKVKHPEWLNLAAEKWGKLADLKRRGLLPESIEGWMFVADARYALRAVYGSDLRASSALFARDLWTYIVGVPRRLRRFWRYKICMKSPDADLNEYLAKMEADDSDEE